MIKDNKEGKEKGGGWNGNKGLEEREGRVDNGEEEEEV